MRQRQATRHLPRGLLLLILASLLAPLCLRADLPDEDFAFGEDSVAAVAPMPSWAPGPHPEAGQWDWIELTSGELLKGEIKSMYHDKMLFESDKLGDLTLKWKDIHKITSATPMSVRLDNRTTVRGEIALADDTVTIKTNGTEEEVARDDVVSLASERYDRGWFRNWTLSATIGADFQAGNTNETAYSAMLSLMRRTALTRYLLSYMGNYAKNEGITTTSNQRASTYFDYYFDRRLFFRPVFAAYYRDPFQNIGQQFTIGSGLGYQIHKDDTIEWEAVAGPVYQVTRFDTVQPGSRQTVSTPGALLQTSVSIDITDDLDFDGTYQFILTNRESGLLTQHFVNKLTYELTDIFDLSLTFIWDRVQNPTQTSTGSTPKKDDFNLILGIGVSY